MAKRVHEVDLEKSPKPVSSSSSSKSSCSNGESPPAPAKKLSFSIAVVVVISVIPLLYLSLLQYHSSPSSVVDDTKFWFLMSNAIILIVAADSGIFAGSAAFRDGPAADVYGPEYYCVKLARPKINAGSGVPRGAYKPAAAPRIQWMTWKDPTARLSTVTQLQLVPSQRSSNNTIPQKEEIKKKTKASLGRLGAVPPQAAILQKEEHMMCEERRFRSAAPELAGASSDGNLVEFKQVLVVSATEKKDRLSSSSSSSSSEYAAMSDDELNLRVEEFIRRFNREIRQQEWS